MLDPCGDTGLEAALGLDTRSFQGIPSAPVYLDNPGQGTSEVFDVGQCVGLLHHAAVVAHNDLFLNPGTFSGLDAFLDQKLVENHPAEHQYASLGPVLTDLNVTAFGLDDVILIHSLLGHTELS